MSKDYTHWIVSETFGSPLLLHLVTLKSTFGRLKTGNFPLKEMLHSKGGRIGKKSTYALYSTIGLSLAAVSMEQSKKIIF
jgi:hypothetical protein